MRKKMKINFIKILKKSKNLHSLSLDSVNDGVPSVCVGVAVPILCGGVHVILLRSVLLPRPDDANEPELFTVDSYSG